MSEPIVIESVGRSVDGAIGITMAGRGRCLVNPTPSTRDRCIASREQAPITILRPTRVNCSILGFRMAPSYVKALSVPDLAT